MKIIANRKQNRTTVKQPNITWEKMKCVTCQKSSESSGIYFNKIKFYNNRDMSALTNVTT